MAESTEEDEVNNSTFDGSQRYKEVSEKQNISGVLLFLTHNNIKVTINHVFLQTEQFTIHS